GIESGERRQQGLLAAGARHQSQLGARHDAERALAADEQLLEVVTRIVLEHPIQRGEHRAVGEYGFDAQHEVTHHSVTQDAQPAGIGGYVAADRAAVARTQVEREHHAVFLGCALHAPELRAGLRAQRSTRHVDSLDGVHRLHRHHDVTAIRIRALHQPGEATVSDHGLTVRVTEPENGCHLLGAARPDEDVRLYPAVKQRAAALAHRRTREHALLTHDRAEIGLEIWPGIGLRHAGAKVAPPD